MKSIIIYGSHHHGSTKALVQAITRHQNVELWDAEAAGRPSLEDYDLIGFASGIDFGRFYPAVTGTAQTLPAGKPVYALFTCAKENRKYGDEIQKTAAERGCTYLGTFGCRGYNTYGPWKLIGGMNKGHPTPEEQAAAIAFYEKVLKAVPL